MSEQHRKFQVSDPFDRVWDAEFRWLQNAISIRHADAVDMKYFLTCEGERREIVIALPHPDLLELARKSNRPLTDAWCLKLASLHLRDLIATWTDIENTLVTVQPGDLEGLAARIDASEDEARRLSARMR